MIIEYVCSKKGGFMCNSVISDGENKHIIEKMWMGCGYEFEMQANTL